MLVGEARLNREVFKVNAVEQTAARNGKVGIHRTEQADVVGGLRFDFKVGNGVIINLVSFTTVIANEATAKICVFRRGIADDL